MIDKMQQQQGLRINLPKLLSLVQIWSTNIKKTILNSKVHKPTADVMLGLKLR